MWSLFDWIGKKRKTPWIDEDEFTEEAEDIPISSPANNSTMDITSNINELQHTDLVLQQRKEIDDFLTTDYDPRGYRDALINPDISNCEDNKSILKYQLELKIERVMSIYENKISDYDFHIKTRKQNGLKDTADEIEAEKKKVEEEIKKIKLLLEESKKNEGKGHVVILSYERGFKRGLAAISNSKLFGKKINND